MIKLTLSMLLAPLCALAEPTARTVSAGSAVFATPPGNALTVTTNPNTVINWSSFSIGKDAAPKYVQPQGVPQLNQLPSNALRPPIGAAILANPSTQPPVGLQMQALQPGGTAPAPASASEVVRLPDGRIIFRVTPQ